MSGYKKSVYESDLYEAMGYSFGEAYRLMAEKIRKPFVPPSLDVFRTELRGLNEGGSSTSPQELAESIIAKARSKGHTRS